MVSAHKESGIDAGDCLFLKSVAPKYQSRYHGRMYEQTDVVKRSPIVIIRNFVALQFTAAGLYIFASSLAYYARIWRGLPVVGHAIPFQVAQAVFTFGIETLIILFIFFSWYRENIRIMPDKIIYDEGVLFRRHTAIPADAVASVMYTQSIFGRLLRYGSVMLKDSQGKLLLRLNAMSDPAVFVDRLMHGRGGSFNDPRALAAMPENEKLERKSSFRWDVQRGAINRSLEKAAMKTVAAFLNTEGGSMILGVDDRGRGVGMESDWATLVRKNADGFENHFSNTLSAMIGPTFRQYVELRNFEHDGKPCVMVAVRPSKKPAFLIDEGREEFFIRTGNGTTSLKISDAATYITSRFGSNG